MSNIVFELWRLLIIFFPKKCFKLSFNSERFYNKIQTVWFTFLGADIYEVCFYTDVFFMITIDCELSVLNLTFYENTIKLPVHCRQLTRFCFCKNILIKYSLIILRHFIHFFFCLKSDRLCVKRKSMKMIIQSR